MRKGEDSYFAYGDHSDVYKGSYGDRPVAIKQLRGVNSNKIEVRLELLEKLQVQHATWRNLEHRNVCKVYCIAEEFGFLPALVMDYYPKGNIIRHIQKHNPPTEQRMNWVFDIANGLAYLHSFAVYHGDLRGGNVFLDNNNRAVIADYGIASYFNSSDFTSAKSTNTVRWSAPETIALPPNPNPQPEKIDIFALGMTMLEVFSGQPPYSDKSDTGAIFAVAKHEGPKLPESITANPGLKDLFETCTRRNPEERPSAQQAAEILQTLLPPPPPPSLAQRVLQYLSSWFRHS